MGAEGISDAVQMAVMMARRLAMKMLKYMILISLTRLDRDRDRRVEPEACFELINRCFELCFSFLFSILFFSFFGLMKSYCVVFRRD